ncbi:ATP-binding protein [Sphingomonas nostoxanthinifaciens]|uniref:ATP-binding protein n=1 Tax=Sphingomonas nostoxanthinifaciens TaxID=2872652 RepID=UPI001CC1D1A8|nr:ATP-binding protein [Sphingomonas nostoxanthinifaciens]UAK23296.1 ATP-binding protein [Sphingomonas nostoxanthinifaciens]
MRTAVLPDRAVDPLAEWLAAVGPRWRDALEQGRAPAMASLHPALPLARLGAALALEPAALTLVELLFAAETDEALALRLEAAGGVTVALAQRLLPALTPDDLALAGALRSHDVLHVGEGPRVRARLRLDPAMLDRLGGGGLIEPWLGAAVRRIEPTEPAPASAIRALALALAERGPDGLSPIVAIDGARADQVAASAAGLGLAAFRLLPDALPVDPVDRRRWQRRWALHAALEEAVLVVTARAEAALPADLLDDLTGHVVLLGNPPAHGLARPIRIVASSEAHDDVAARWLRAFGAPTARRLGPAIAGAARRFALDAAQLARVAAEAGPRIAAEPDATAAARLLWRAAARAVSPVAVTGCVRREPQGGWDDLVVPQALAATLRRIESHLRHAEQVMHGWGFAARMGGRGTGVAALFAGPSGTGKTMAAEVIAAALDLPILEVDLAQLTSKYIGETSKNIAAIFAEAERTGAAMVWNEGDAIFGARGQVVQASDRHVNAEVGDLLQRIEAFTGLTIVTTNLKASIDAAFLRRFRFVADFPLPSEVERRAIWRRAFPPGTPLALDEATWGALATVGLSGGAIRNAALGAAFAAAAAGTEVRAAMVVEALADELAKSGQPMPVLAIGGAA